MFPKPQGIRQQATFQCVIFASLIFGLLVNQHVLSNSSPLRSILESPAKKIFYSPTATGISQQMVLAYVWPQNKNSAIYTITVDDPEPKQLTDGKAHDFHPVWSPDGRFVAFTSDRDSTSVTTRSLNIYVIEATGKNLRRITQNSFDNFSPTWSPDGKTIAFASTRKGNTQIYLIDVDKLTEHALTSGETDNTQPAWSPDGKLIAFVSNRTGNYEIYVMKPEGSDVSQLTSTHDAYQPAWSPDSESLAFREGTEYIGMKISIVTLSNRKKRSLTTEGLRGEQPSWSSNSKFIAYSAVVDDRANIFIINLDSFEIQRITDGIEPAWKP